MSWGLMLIAIVIGFGIFLISRQLTLWAWRVGEMANNLAYIANHYRLLDQAERQRRAEFQRGGSIVLVRRSRGYPGVNESPTNYWSNN